MKGTNCKNNAIRYRAKYRLERIKEGKALPTYEKEKIFYL